MALFKVSLTGHFCKEIEVEFEPDENGIFDETEIQAIAVTEFEDEYQVVGQWGESFDYVDVDAVEEVE
jgi:hypothetical protein